MSLRTGLKGAKRRAVIRQLFDEMYAGGDHTCPVCRVNIDRVVEEHRRETERLRGALMLIAGQENTLTHHDDGPTLSLDAEEKMRRIAREVLR